MTTMCAVLGGVPLALGTGIGLEIRQLCDRRRPTGVHRSGSGNSRAIAQLSLWPAIVMR